MIKKAKLLDIAEALGISTGTVHRALHNHAGVSSVTKARVQQMAKTLGYRPNLAARYLSSKAPPLSGTKCGQALARKRAPW